MNFIFINNRYVSSRSFPIIIDLRFYLLGRVLCAVDNTSGQVHLRGTRVDHCLRSPIAPRAVKPDVHTYAKWLLDYSISLMASSSYRLQNLYDLTRRVAVVTGGGTGIGLMIAKGLAANGAKVYITGRRTEVLQNVVNSWDGEGNGSLNAYVCL